MNILVTGANGLVGSRLIRRLRRSGHDVSATGLGPQRVVFEQVRYVAADLTTHDAVAALIAELKPAVIVNCAGKTDVDGCERDRTDAWNANAAAVAFLAQAATANSAHLIHVSTDYVFDGDAGPYETTSIPNPRGVYALTKYAGEVAVQSLCAPGTWAIARTAVVYGWPRAGKNNFGSWLIDSFRKKTTVKLFEDQWVSPSLALNVADMLSELAEERRSGIWHVAGAEVVDRVQFGRALCERFGFDATLIQPSRMKDVSLPSPRPAKSGLVVAGTAAHLKTKPLTLSAALDAFRHEVEESP